MLNLSLTPRTLSYHSVIMKTLAGSVSIRMMREKRFLTKETQDVNRKTRALLERVQGRGANASERSGGTIDFPVARHHHLPIVCGGIR
jgi:hypothetical protein